MDVSALFKASVKTVNLRNKELGTVTNTKDLLKKTRNKSSFHFKAHDVVVQISRLREFLLKSRKVYLDFHNHLCTASHMTDAERDEIDAGAQNIMSICSQLVKDLKREVAACELSQQNMEHREIMLLMIEDYLKNVCKIYSEQKAMRVKKAMEMRKIVRLQSDTKFVDQSSSITDDRKLALNATQKLTDDHESKNDSNDSSPMKIQEINGDVNTLTYEEELSPEDIQMFHSENEQLYSELNTLTEEVSQIESKVVHIAELQEIFTEKILDQDKDLDRLMTTVVGSTENVKEANEQIRQAIQRNAGLRVWILFFLLVMSFSLLFLDWYNP
ncbi:syntaxin-18 [Odontomachus brunneus]|uniref:syntaxin-18 n=1 Tax=Odontomachus brunneus TaxID=486640 RepID=UPI0013F190E8|nr:syntaxin-18 [Odontomachus brunneus]XP_032674755.1 syntaxin-18 [Odontomachus brunneus]XP_032674757.1 syntaxin-18 [Odontomachus brunneus]XP_032674758.1 syntaxin-18 [Odontomachus brunneus]XP_032674759.1 syntaxin-18 [Odontomachus brunneus]XP_032674760.1 syntaxin-18 [Odontomachus brunneus]